MQKALHPLALTFSLALSSQLAFGQYARHSSLLHHPEDPPALVRLVRLPIQAAHREEFLRAANQLETVTRQEAGCVGYRVYEDVNDRNTFFVAGEWASAAALEGHRRQPYTAAYFQQLPQWLAAPASTTGYEASKRTLTTVVPAAK